MPKKSEIKANSTMFSRFVGFIKYWYFRYLLVSELYMVETWEKVVTHVLIGLLFFSLWKFNSSVLLPNVSSAVTLAKSSLSDINFNNYISV